MILKHPHHSASIPEPLGFRRAPQINPIAADTPRLGSQFPAGRTPLPAGGDRVRSFHSTGLADV